MKRFSYHFILVFLLSCSEKIDPDVFQPTSSWNLIQHKILEPNCVVCHTSGTTFANQSGLVLTSNEAYDQLIDQPPTNLAAKNDGLMRLGTKGIESLQKSFLWEKINAADWEHFYEDHPEYGELMPLGSKPLTNGELEYIRQWIIAGAPEDGFVADEKLLNDSSRIDIGSYDFAPLPLPDFGLQMHLGPFPVKPQFERELFNYQKVGNESDIYINRIEISMKPGSHHFILYEYPDQFDGPELNVFRDVRNEDNQLNWETISEMNNQIFVFGTQLRITDYKYPDGVAIKIPGNKAYDMNSHYVNYSDNEMEGEVYINLYQIDHSEVQYEAKQLFLNNTSIKLPPNQVTTLTKEFIFDEPRNVFMLTSHAHQHQTEFKIYIVGGDRDGELVYYSNDWEHPPLINYPSPIQLDKGEGLKVETTYNNDTDNFLTFGLLSTDEMMIIFGCYY